MFSIHFADKRAFASVVETAVKLTKPDKELRFVGSKATGRTFCPTTRTISKRPGDMEAKRKRNVFIHKRAAGSQLRSDQWTFRTGYPDSTSSILT